MNESLDDLALRKRLLQARASLCRIRIRYELKGMRDTLHWARAGAAAAGALPVRSTLLGLALHGAAHGRLARAFALAARMLVFARLAGIAADLLRKPRPAPPAR